MPCSRRYRWIPTTTIANSQFFYESGQGPNVQAWYTVLEH